MVVIVTAHRFSHVLSIDNSGAHAHEFIDMFKDAWRHKDIRILYKAPDWVDQHYRNSAAALKSYRIS